MRARGQRFRREDAKQKDNLERAIAPIWSLLAAAVCQTLPPEASAEVDDNQPGYVVFRVDELRVFVPFFVANVFPHGEILKAICELGAQLQIGTDSVICVSGSACQLGLGLPIGDLDFCEYLPAGDARIADRFLSRLFDLSQQALCFRLTLGEDKVWVRPWPTDLAAGGPAIATELRTAMTGAGFRQCAFVADVPSLGILEATNVVVLLDYAALESLEANRSFAAQEAPLARESWTPRELTSPLALGAYVIWLIDSAYSLCDQSQSEPRAAVKAVRRAFSATRLLFLRKETDELANLLGKDAARLAALFDRCRLYSSISKIPEQVMREHAAKLRLSIDQVRNTNTLDDSSYSQLTEQEAQQLSAIRDASLPVILRILDDVTRMLDIDMCGSAGARYDKSQRGGPTEARD